MSLFGETERMARSLEGSGANPDDLIARLECEGLGATLVSEVVCGAICKLHRLNDRAAHAIVALSVPPSVAQTLRMLRHFEAVEQAGGQATDAFLVAMGEALGAKLDHEPVASLVMELLSSPHERIRVTVALSAECACETARELAALLLTSLGEDPSPTVVAEVERVRKKLRE